MHVWKNKKYIYFEGEQNYLVATGRIGIEKWD